MNRQAWMFHGDTGNTCITPSIKRRGAITIRFIQSYVIEHMRFLLERIEKYEKGFIIIDSFVGGLFNN